MFYATKLKLKLKLCKYFSTFFDFLTKNFKIRCINYNKKTADKNLRF